jgi:two-component system chemotaxis response regulator CheY
MNGSGIRILVVDDFAAMRRIIRTILKRLGYTEIEEAEEGRSALEKLRTRDFNLVIADWNMPGMDGLELLKAIRSDRELKDLPFLMITAEAKKNNILEAVRAGVTNYIVKPFTEDLLSKKLREIFQTE